MSSFDMGVGRPEKDSGLLLLPGSDEEPAHQVSVKGFRLDLFEVNAGRFRTFVESYNATPPPSSDSYGWKTEWNLAIDGGQMRAIARGREAPHKIAAADGALAWTEERVDTNGKVELKIFGMAASN